MLNVVDMVHHTETSVDVIPKVLFYIFFIWPLHEMSRLPTLKCLLVTRRRSYEILAPEPSFVVVQLLSIAICTSSDRVG